MTITTKKIAGAAVLISVVLFTVAGAANSSITARSATPPYKIYLSNTLLNNGWRPKVDFSYTGGPDADFT